MSNNQKSFQFKTYQMQYSGIDFKINFRGYYYWTTYDNVTRITPNAPNEDDFGKIIAEVTAEKLLER